MRHYKCSIILIVFTLCVLLVFASKTGQNFNWWDKLFALFGIRTGSIESKRSINERNEIESLNNVELLLEKAKDRIKSGYIDNQAVSILLNALELNPEHYEANYLTGTALLALRSSSQAQGFLYKAVELSNWTEHNAIANLAEALRLTGDIELASIVAQKGISQSHYIDPSGMLSFTLGSIFLSKQNYVSAADWFLKSALQQESNIDLWLKASTLQFPLEAHELNFAQNVLIEGIKLNPENSFLHLYMGIAMQKASKFEEALTFYAEALRFDGTNFDAHVNTATTLHTLHRNVEALHYYEAAYTLNPANTILVSNYARLLATVGRHNEAIGMVTRAIDSGSSNADSLQGILQSIELEATGKQEIDQKISDIQALVADAVRASDWDRVVKVAVDFGEPNDSSPWWYFSVGMAMIFKGEIKTGYDFCKRAEQFATNSHLVHGCLGISAQQLGELAVAAHHFGRAYEILISNTNVQSMPDLGFYASQEEMKIGLLTVLHDAGNYDRCLDWLSIFVNLPPMDQGGALIIILTQLTWSQKMIDKIPFAEQYARENGDLFVLPKETTLLSEIERIVSSSLNVAHSGQRCLLLSEIDSIKRAKSFAGNIVSYLNED